MRQAFLSAYFDGDESVRGNLKEAAFLAGYSRLTVQVKAKGLRAAIIEEETRRRKSATLKDDILLKQQNREMFSRVQKVVEQAESPEPKQKPAVNHLRFYDDPAGEWHWFRSPSAYYGPMAIDLTSTAAIERRARAANGENLGLANTYIQKFRRLGD